MLGSTGSLGYCISTALEGGSCFLDLSGTDSSPQCDLLLLVLMLSTASKQTVMERCWVLGPESPWQEALPQGWCSVIVLCIPDAPFSLQILMFLKAQLILRQTYPFNEVYFLLVPIKELWNQWWLPCQWNFGIEVILFVALGKVFAFLSPNFLIYKRTGLS